MNIGSPAPITDFSLDVLGRYVCNTFDEALVTYDPNARVTANLPPRSDLRPFDFIVIGGGTFGAAVAEHLWFRSKGRSERILVLDGGPFLLPEHTQNLPMISLGNEVWGLPWNANTGFPGLAYCLGGRSLFWGGWSPRLLGSETPTGVWPQSVIDDLNASTLRNGDHGYFRQSSDQIGVSETNDYIFGELHTAMREQLLLAIKSGTITDAIPLSVLPDSPPVANRDTAPTLADLAAMLGVPLPNPLPTAPADLANLEQDLRDALKLEAPLAVQGRPGHAGFFPLNKFSAVPLLIKAARGAFGDSGGDDVKKRLMVVPRCHVMRLSTTNDPAGRRVDGVVTERGTIPVSTDAKVIVALGTIESSRLSLLSFGSDGRIGSNLMAHLRSNVDIRIPREALSSLSASVHALQSSALFLKGQHRFTRPDGTEDGTVGHFHLQITASGLGNTDTNSEAELFQKIPDIDTVSQHLNATDTHVVISIRGVGEMEPGNPASNVTLDLNPIQTDFGERKAFVNFNATVKDMQLWEVMDSASDDVAAAFAGGQKVDVIIRNKGLVKATGVDATAIPSAAVLPHMIPDPNNPGRMLNNPERRDGLGTTHHEAGTLRMGSDANTSVTDADCRFHGVKNAYVVGPALFPSIGSPNPMLTGIALARRLGDHLAPPPPIRALESGFTWLFQGTEDPKSLFASWQMAGGGRFDLIGRTLVARPGNGIGLLYYAAQQFDDFTLRVDFCLPHPRGNNNDNSGVFVRFRDPRKSVPLGYPPPDVPGNPATIAVDTGYEIQIDEEARGDTRKSEADGFFYNRTGAVYKIKNPGTVPGQQKYTNTLALAASVWHCFEIRVTGRNYVVILDGQASSAFTADSAEQFRGKPMSEDPDSGFIGIQVHTGSVAFANIRISVS